MAPDPPTSGSDAADEIDIEAPAGGSVWDRRFAYAFLTALFVTPVAAGGGLIYYGYLTPSITVEASVQIGWIIEYAIAAFVAAFLVFTLAQLARVAGVGFLNSLFSAAATVADGYRLPENRGDNE